MTTTTHRRRPLSRLALGLTLAATSATLTTMPSASASEVRSTASACGVDRWSVKTGTDPDATKIDLSSTTPTTIGKLAALPVPATVPDNQRVPPTETTVFGLTAVLTQYKVEDDSDYHLVLQDPSSSAQMIAELPAPACVGPTSPLLPGITAARAAFDRAFTATTSWKTTRTPVSLRGVGFFDDDHGQTGVAANGIELHPVLQFGLAPTPTPTPTPAPLPQVRVSVRPGLITAGGSTVVALRGVPGERLGLWAYTWPSHTYHLIRTGNANNVGLASWSVRPGADSRFYGTAAGGARRSGSVVLQVRRPAPAPTTAAPAPAVYYANCDAVRAAGKAPLYQGQPGYRAGLDRDGDGIACE